MLRVRLEATPELLQDFELAAEEKYRQGLDLLQRHPGGGIYLLGYCAEMILKYACFRAQGYRPGTVLSGLFGPARSWMMVRYPNVEPEGYHSLRFWMYYLRARRRQLGNALPARVDWQLVRRTRRLYQIWWVEMRYRPDQAQPQEAAATYDDVSWLRANRVRLWS
jgi:hypothetical protein